jgi:apolipoprotein N-acyltransferase
MIFSIVSALLHGACFPGTVLSLMVFISLVPFLLSLARAESVRVAFFRGALFGSLFSIIAAYWIFNALYFHYQISFFISLLFMIGTLVLPLALVYGAFAALYRFFFCDCIFYHGLMVPSLWVLFEFVREFVPLYLPWALAGYSLAGFPVLIQIADIVGVYGLSFLIVSINSLVAAAFLHGTAVGLSLAAVKTGPARVLREFAAKSRISVVAVPVIIIAMLLYGTLRMGQWKSRVEGAPPEQKLTARVIQGNFSQRDRWDSRNVYEILESNLALMGDVKGGSRFLVVWPETVLNAGGALRDAILSRLVNEIGENSLLVFGGTRQAGTETNHNSAYYLSGKGAVKVYDKIILLPFAETTPFGIRLLGAFYEAPERFDRGRLPSVAGLEGVNLGFTICFEKIYSWFVRGQAAAGAALLVNISNDSWFGRSTNPYQSLDTGILRAVENRRYMIISSNSGISSVITPWGECAARTGLFTRERADAEVVLLTERSLYTRIGDVVLYLAVLIIAVAGWNRFFREGDK